MSTESAFGKRLREIRKSKGMTQEQLAEASGIHRVTIASVESGLKGNNPVWTTVQALAKGLGVDCTAFAETETKAKKPKK